MAKNFYANLSPEMETSKRTAKAEKAKAAEATEATKQAQKRAEKERVESELLIYQQLLNEQNTLDQAKAKLQKDLERESNIWNLWRLFS